METDPSGTDPGPATEPVSTPPAADAAPTLPADNVEWNDVLIRSADQTPRDTAPRLPDANPTWNDTLTGGGEPHDPTPPPD